MYSKHVRWARDVKTIPLDTGIPVPIGDWARGGLISRIYLRNFTSGRIDIRIHGSVIQSFTREYITIRQTMTTPSERVLIDTELTLIPCCSHLPSDDIDVMVEGDADQLIVEYALFDMPLPKAPVLFEQVQYETFEVQSGIPVRMNFLHEVKELIFVVRGTLDRLQIRLNDTIKIDQSALYFRTVQALQYHTHAPPRAPHQEVFSYSFCMKPESEEYTGSVHMGRVQHQACTFWGTLSHVTIYAISYNILTSDRTIEFVNS